MNRTSTLLLVALTTIGVTSAASLASMATASSPPLHSVQTFTVWTRGGSRTYLNLSGKKGGGIGDLTVLEQPVYTSPTAGTRIGEGFAAVTALSPTKGQIHADLYLRHGTIDLGGVQDQSGNVFTLAVTGGTGTYLDVRGQATIKLLNGNRTQNPSMITLELDR